MHRTARHTAAAAAARLASARRQDEYRAWLGLIDAVAALAAHRAHRAAMAGAPRHRSDAVATSKGTGYRAPRHLAA